MKENSLCFMPKSAKPKRPIRVQADSLRSPTYYHTGGSSYPHPYEHRMRLQQGAPLSITSLMPERSLTVTNFQLTPRTTFEVDRPRTHTGPRIVMVNTSFHSAFHERNQHRKRIPTFPELALDPSAKKKHAYSQFSPLCPISRQTSAQRKDIHSASARTGSGMEVIGDRVKSSHSSTRGKRIARGNTFSAFAKYNDIANSTRAREKASEGQITSNINDLSALIPEKRSNSPEFLSNEKHVRISDWIASTSAALNLDDVIDEQSPPKTLSHAAKNFCRNPDGVYWPWCYTTNPKVKWDYCHVEACDDDCFTNESPFAEPLKHTVGGHGCQPWYSNYPHEHDYHNDTWYPDGSQIQADNYCRNTGGSGWWPWCYTTDPNVRWDYCPVEGCYALDDVESEDPINSDCYSGSGQYAGSISHTIGGHSCQPWTSNYPHEHNYNNDTLYPEQSQAAAENFCRSPDGSHPPWCYTTDPTARWEYCPVDGCEYEEPSPEEPCFDDTALYSGKISHTISGRTCQPWISNYPHQHKFHNDTEYPGGSQVVAENFCRNLGEKKWWPWCYTTDPSVRWEYCPVKGCTAPEEIVEDCFTKPSSYLGQVSNTVSGTTCQHWVLDEPHKHEFHNNSFFPGETKETAVNYCRSAGGKHWPWCYTNNPDVRWEFCPVNGCDQACFSNKRPYAGRQSKTISGRTCQPWVNNYPHEHDYHNGSMYPENTSKFMCEGDNAKRTAIWIFAVNYCRNPDENNWWPWCYTTDPEKRWEFCPMEACKYTFSCEQGWYHDEQAGYCYKSSAQYTTFQDAQTFCANNYNANLPSVLDANSLSFLSSVIMKDRLHATWVGATNNYDDWRMLDGGQFGFPVQSRVLGSQKACAVFSPPVSIDTLYDDFCEDRWQFICQKQATSSLVTDEGGVL